MEEEKTLKMYFWVRTDIKIPKGKAANQVGHSAGRMSADLMRHGLWNQYVRDGEVIIVYKTNGLPNIREVLDDLNDIVEISFMRDRPRGGVEGDGPETVLGLTTRADVNKDRRWKLL